MAIQWSSGSGSSNPHYVGIDVSISGTKVTARYYVRATYSVSDNQTLTRTGKITGSTNYRKEGPGQVLVYTGSFTGSRGKTYTLGAKLSGIYNGGAPSVSRKVTVPATVPSKPSKPSVSGVTASNSKATVAAPASNGASITSYGWQIENLGTGGTSSATTTGRTWTRTNNSANTRYRIRVRARNSAGWSSWSSWSNTFTTKPLAANSPTGVGATRSTDSRINVSWTRRATTARPYTRIRVQRQDDANTSWVTVGTASGSATSYGDTSVRAGRRYRYRVRAENSGGNSSYVTSGYANTTPAAPSGLKVTKRGGSITVAWTRTAQAGHSVQVWHSQNGTWGSGPLTTSTGTTYTHSPDPAATHQYRIRSMVSNPTLYSGYVTSQVVQLMAPPAAPTPVSPVGGWDRDAPIRFEWVHNSVDSSEQSAFELRYRIDGGEWAYEGGEDAEWAELPAAGDSGELEWQVRTKGDHADWGPYSPIQAVTLAGAPDPSLDLELSEFDLPIVTVVWDYYSPEGSPMAGLEIELIDAEGEVVERATPSGARDSWAFETVVEDGSEWQMRFRVRDGNGLYSEWIEHEFSPTFPGPPAPIVSADWNPIEGYVEIDIENPPPDVEDPSPEPEHNDLYRSVDGGESWTLVEREVALQGSVIDPLAPAAGEALYRAIAWSDIPSATASADDLVLINDPRHEHHAECSTYISGGPGFGQICRALYEQQLSLESGRRDRVLHYFSGRELAVEFSGPARERMLNLKWIILAEQDDDGGASSTLIEWERLASLPGPHLFRDCQGRRFYASLSPLQATRLPNGLYDASLTVTEISA